jgi:exonuclease SbcD
MRFTFIHAADLHIDSPFAGLGVKDAAVAERFFKAGRKAVETLIAEAIDSKAAFLIIAGDIFDGDWKDVPTGHFFVRMLGALHRAGIPTVLAKGNHDADSVMSRSLRYPETVRTFASNKAETIVFDEHRVALHGRSFGSRRAPDDFVGSYPARREDWLNIGVLHTALDGTRGHESYAPCTVEDLCRFGYDYWALGHIHAAETVSKDPWIVYPGNLQGRSVRELGPKGAVRVTVEHGRIVEVTPLILDAARWAHETLDVSACTDEAAALDLIHDALKSLHPQAGGRPLAVRFTLSGTTPAHARLVARRETIEEEARALGFQFAEDCWVEQVKLATSAPARLVAAIEEPDALDVEALLAAAAEDPEFSGVLAELMAGVADKLPRDLRSEIPSDDPHELARLAALARDYLTGALAP